MPANRHRQRDRHSHREALSEKKKKSLRRVDEMEVEEKTEKRRNRKTMKG